MPTRPISVKIYFCPVAPVAGTSPRDSNCPPRPGVSVAPVPTADPRLKKPSMVALSRYVDEAGKPQLAVMEKNPSAPGLPRLCPVSALVGPRAAEQWVQDDAFCGQADLLRSDLPSPRVDQWIDAPMTLLPPVGRPEKVLCIGLNYRDHALETGTEPPAEPIVFSKFNSSLIGYGQPIVLPRISRRVDYEAELVVVIGATVRHVAAEDALSCVFGYTCGHDVSARDWQKGRPGGQWLLAKSFDTFAPVGPCVVTADEIPDPGNLGVRMQVDDQTMQDSVTSQLIFDVPTLIAHLSQFMTLRPGDLIFTGTPPGVGAARQPPRFLKPGDHCTVEIDSIGRLSNPVLAER